MKPPLFEYVAPSTVAEAISALQQFDGEARVLSGGQSLVPMLNMRLAQPPAVIDLNCIEGLRTIRIEESTVHIGALVRYVTLTTNPIVSRHVPLLGEAVRLVGDPQVRNRGTIGGSVAHADSSGEVPLVALVQGAVVVAQGPDGVRHIGFDEFLKGAYETDLDPLEIITEVVFPDASSACSAIVEHVRRHGDFSVVAVAAVGTPTPGGHWDGVRLAVSGASPRPFLLSGSEALASGTVLGDTEIAAVAAECLELADPSSDVRASADFRRQLLPVYVERALHRLKERRGSSI